MNILRNFSIIIALAFFASGCSRSAATPQQEGEKLTSEATLLDIRDMGGSYLVTIKNPWDTSAILHSYQLVPRGGDVPPRPGATTVEIPLTRSVVYSGVHGSAINELGATRSIIGVADAAYFTLPAIKAALVTGRIKDIGPSTRPIMERLVALRPDAIITSPYQNAGYGPLEQIDVPIIEMADYMESTPLGRAEWIKLLGLLYGQYNRADSLYHAVSQSYNAIAAKAAALSSHPKVITEQLISGIWAVPGGRSYKAQMLRDAGATYPWSDESSAGSLQLDFSAVFDKAADADFWFVTSYGLPLSRSMLRADYQGNERIKAWRDGNVYTCDTSVVPLFDEFPFHPERLLQDYVSIIHGEEATGLTPRYFHRAD